MVAYTSSPMWTRLSETSSPLRSLATRLRMPESWRGSCKQPLVVLTLQSARTLTTNVHKRSTACNSTVCDHTNLCSSEHSVVHPVTRLQQCNHARQCQQRQQQRSSQLRYACTNFTTHHEEARAAPLSPRRQYQALCWGLAAGTAPHADLDQTARPLAGMAARH
jgi:hypothetical protein